MGSKFFKADYDTATHRKCLIHGVMLIEGNFYPCKGKSRHGKAIIIYKCRICQRARRTARYHTDPQKSHDEVFAWRLNNPEAIKAITNRSYAKNKKKYLPRFKAKRLARKLLVLGHYSGGEPKCQICGDGRHQFLALDHIDGGGSLHHEALGPDHFGEKFYKWIIAHSFPDGYRVLCHNHNFKEHLKANRAAFAAKEWNETNLYKTRIVSGKAWQVDKRKLAKAGSIYKAAIKLECLVRYSSLIPICACCQEEDQEVLSIDHVGGGGKKHRIGLKVRGNAFYKYLRDAGFPSGYRVLCLNCNFALGLYGNCPHQDI